MDDRAMHLLLAVGVFVGALAVFRLARAIRALAAALDRDWNLSSDTNYTTVIEDAIRGR